MRTTTLICLAWLAGAPLSAQEKEPLEKRVERSMQKAVHFLRDHQRKDGSWETDVPAVVHEGGWTALALLGLLSAGVSPEDRTVTAGLASLRKIKPRSVYVRALQTMAFAEAGQTEDRKRIEENVAWLIKARVIENGRFEGWSYSDKNHVIDNSNTQYAVLGLWAGHKAGVPIDKQVWRDVREHYLRSQGPDGCWDYRPHAGAPHPPSITMTLGGISGLVMSDAVLGKERGLPASLGARAMGLEWVDANFAIQVPQRTFYYLHCLCVAGKLSGRPEFAGQDWYVAGSEWLLERQQKDGSWTARGIWDQWPVVSTSFALIFLVRDPRMPGQ